MADTYTVVKGDTLWGIASRFLGAGIKYKQLAAINNIANPNRIYVGQVIKLSKDSSSSSTSTATNSNKPTINQFGLQSDTDSTLFATWSWSNSNTASYQVMWYYDTGDSVWFVGNDSPISVSEHDPASSRQSTYTIPSNAKKVKFKVKPISKTYTKNDKETSYWTAVWSEEKTYNVSDLPPTAPSTPTVTIEKYALTATLSNLDVNGTSIQFQVVKDDAKVFKTGSATIITSSASYSCTVDAGGNYKVRARSCRGNIYSDWSTYSSNVQTIPSTPSGITTIRANSDTSVYLEWPAVNTADTYELEYATKKTYFDVSDATTTVSGIETTQYEKTGLESGEEYFFRVRATNEAGSSPWSGIKSVLVGKKPAAPTTWSSTTTAITGTPVNLYWVHNSVDGSSQTYAELEMEIGGVKATQTITNSTDEDEKDKTSVYALDTSDYIEGTQILWRVRTAGVTRQYGDWSIQRTIQVYAPPTLALTVVDGDGDSIETLTQFPFYVNAIAGPNTQTPIGYHVIVTSNSSYETVDNIGNVKMVSAGEQIYSKYFDTNYSSLVEFTPSNIDLENNVTYTVSCTVTMNSGLNAESSVDFTVSWSDDQYSPNAEIGIDEETYTASIRPYCEQLELNRYEVTLADGVYTKTSTTLDGVYGEIVAGVLTETGEQVYSGVTDEDEEVYFCEVQTSSLIPDISLSVYRREYDGSFTELATGLVNGAHTYITDPHPALDYARYRIVAISDLTGAVSYSDLPGYPVGGTAVIIQWNEEWSYFETSLEGELEQPPWSGSLLRLPYNIDVSESNSSDVSLVEYIGRSNPIAYYGTQIGETATWNVAIDKKDEETIYSLRRLAKWMGDVYVREPSGIGYWANISVSFSQKHMEVTVPVTLTITRVEGGA